MQWKKRKKGICEDKINQDFYNTGNNIDIAFTFAAKTCL